MSNLSNIYFTDENIREIDLLDNFYRNCDLSKLALQFENELLTNKRSVVPILLFSTDIDSFNDLKRVSINRTVKADNSNNRLLQIEDLKYPPKRVIDKIYYNRVNYRNQSVFYGGFGRFQALFENSPQIGDLFTVSTWRQKPEMKIRFAIIFHDKSIQQHSELFTKEWNDYQRQLMGLDERTRKSVEKLFSIITFFFIRPVEPSKKIEYLFSANLANRMFEMPYTPKVEAILYPSVPMGYIAWNLAILPEAFDKNFDLVTAEEYIVLHKPNDKNQWISQKIADATSSSEGNLLWTNQYFSNDFIDLLKSYNVDINLII